MYYQYPSTTNKIHGTIMRFLKTIILSEEYLIKGLFGSVVAVAFQIAFRAKMHANDVFLFFKNHF
jgi:hypothetical protein